MQDRAIGVEHHDRSSSEAFEQTVDHANAERIEYVGVLEGRTGRDVLDAFGAAEASCGGREIGRNTQDHCVFQVGGSLVECANTRLTRRSVDRREDVEHHPLTG